MREGLLMVWGEDRFITSDCGKGQIFKKRGAPDDVTSHQFPRTRSETNWIPYPPIFIHVLDIRIGFNVKVTESNKHKSQVFVRGLTAILLAGRFTEIGTIETPSRQQRPC
jgi:hypothetical protein